MSQNAFIASWSADGSFVARLAQFFPTATAVRIPVRVCTGTQLSEETVIEFGTPREVLFASALPLEFGDKLRLENPDGLLAADAAVVAVQFHDGKRAVAARFEGEVTHWIIRK